MDNIMTFPNDNEPACLRLYDRIWEAIEGGPASITMAELVYTLESIKMEIMLGEQTTDE